MCVRATAPNGNEYRFILRLTCKHTDLIHTRCYPFSVHFNRTTQLWGVCSALSTHSLSLYLSLAHSVLWFTFAIFPCRRSERANRERKRKRWEEFTTLRQLRKQQIQMQQKKKNYCILCAYHGLKFLSSAFEWKYEIDSFVAIWTKLTKRSRVLHIVCVAQCSISKMKSSCWSSAIVQRSLFILFRFIRTFCINNDDGCLSFCIGALSSPVYSSSSHKNYTHAHRGISKIIIKFWKHSKHQIGYHICIVYVCSVPESVCDSISYMPLLRNMFWLDRQRMMFSSNIPAMWR